MKRILLSILAAVALVSVSRAQAPAFTYTSVFDRFQCLSPQFDQNGNVTAAKVQAYWNVTVHDTTGTVPDTKAFLGVGWDVAAKAATTVTVGAKTYTYAEIFAAVCAIANQEKATQGLTANP